PPVLPAAGLEDSASPWAPSPAASEPVGARGKATGITGIFEPLPVEPVPAAAGAAEPAAQSAAGGEDPVDDHTVVVPRKRAPQWRLVLPDGESYDLESDVIVGRRPEAADGSTVLSIADPTRTLSKSHVRMRFDGERWTVEDLGSTNGLVLLHEGGREEELEAHREVEATDRMMFGTLEVRLQRGGDAA
ncbi:MAG: FHA domain-containing protein, partial [Leucobacter sp.]